MTFLDAPMGDFFWMSRCLPVMARNLPPGGELVYMGVDVAATALEVADRHRAGVAAETPADRKITMPPFALIDLAEPGVFLPRGRAANLSHDAYDVVMCMDALMRVRRAGLLPTGRGDAATVTFCGDGSRRRRSCHVDILWRRVAATPLNSRPGRRGAGTCPSTWSPWRCGT